MRNAQPCGEGGRTGAQREVLSGAVDPTLGGALPLTGWDFKSLLPASVLCAQTGNPTQLPALHLEN